MVAAIALELCAPVRLAEELEVNIGSRELFAYSQGYLVNLIANLGCCLIPLSACPPAIVVRGAEIWFVDTVAANHPECTRAIGLKCSRCILCAGINLQELIVRVSGQCISTIDSEEGIGVIVVLLEEVVIDKVRVIYNTLEGVLTALNHLTSQHIVALSEHQRSHSDFLKRTIGIIARIECYLNIARSLCLEVDITLLAKLNLRAVATKHPLTVAGLDKPLIERIVTVTGKSVKNPCNLKVRMGTPVGQLVEYAGGMPEDTGKLISGGPMMGRPLLDETAPVVKGTSGVLMIPEKEAARQAERNCIRCAKCVQACPMGLEPYLLASASKAADWECAEDHWIMSCIECGCCQSTCPSRRPLLDWVRLAKNRVGGIIRARNAKN